MKVTEVIKKLEELKKKYGDIEVYASSCSENDNYINNWSAEIQYIGFEDYCNNKEIKICYDIDN